MLETWTDLWAAISPSDTVIPIDAPHGMLEYWAFRYQTLLAGVLAIVGAFIGAGAILYQVRESKRQHVHQLKITFEPSVKILTELAMYLNKHFIEIEPWNIDEEIEDLFDYKKISKSTRSKVSSSQFTSFYTEIIDDLNERVSRYQEISKENYMKKRRDSYRRSIQHIARLHVKDIEQQIRFLRSNYSAK